jgi:hypothetical protein
MQSEKSKEESVKSPLDNQCIFIIILSKQMFTPLDYLVLQTWDGKIKSASSH